VRGSSSWTSVSGTRTFYPSHVSPDAAELGLAGTWRLLEYVDRDRESDPWTPTFGTSPAGILLYHPTGLLSIQIAAARDDFTASYRYLGYFGTYELGEARSNGDAIVGVVEHHMKAAFPPELFADDPERIFTLSGDRLMLGDGLTWRRTFERVV